MNFHPFVRKAAAAAFVAFSASAAMAVTAVPAPAAWSFSQSYGANGSITGLFTGVDLNNDQLITYIDGSPLNELLSLTLSVNTPSFTGSFGPGKITIGGDNTAIVEFQYVIGSSNMDAIKPGNPVSPSVVTLVTPVIPGTQPANAYLIWTAGSATYDPLGQYKGSAMVFDTDANILGDYLSTQAVQVQPATLPAVPEPSTWLFMASGLALLSLSARRRANR